MLGTHCLTHTEILGPLMQLGLNFMHCLTLEINGHWGPAFAGRAGTSTGSCAVKAPQLVERF